MHAYDHRISHYLNHFLVFLEVEVVVVILRVARVTILHTNQN